MANLSKLDEAIDQIEKQAELLKQNNNVLTKVSDLSTIMEKGANELIIGNKNFSEVKKDIQNSLQTLINNVSNLEKQNENHIEILISSNKKFIRELEDTISSKLERFSSDIQVTIRQERIQLQESLQNNITSQFNILESKQKILFESQAKRLLILKILLIIVIVLCIVLGIKLFI